MRQPRLEALAQFPWIHGALDSADAMGLSGSGRPLKTAAEDTQQMDHGRSRYGDP